MDLWTQEFWIKIAVTLFCGGLIGLERQLKSKPSGIRTSIFICMGTCFFISLGTALTGQNIDGTRILGQVVTGIGFLGAGVIISREGLLLGMTSASVIWMLAGIGAMVGFNYYKEAVVIAIITVFILVGIGMLESKFAIFRNGFPPNPGLKSRKQSPNNPLIKG